MGGLTIYKASAGAGKTFQLTSEYLKLILDAQGDFRKILAVTFTNKATAEMRHRIVSELYTIAQGQLSAHNAELTKTLGITEPELVTRAEKCLNTILHNYSQFKISTIDSFFQRVIKSFTREVGLNFGFNIELDTDGVIADTIALFIDTITDDKELYQWLVNYSAQKMSDHKGWDIETDLAAFAKKTFNEAFFSLSETQLEELSQIETFQHEKKRLAEILAQNSQYLASIGQRSIKALAKYGLSVDDFYFKKTGPAGFLNKMATIPPEKLSENSYVMKAYQSADKIEGWYNPKNAPTNIAECVNHELYPALCDYFKWRTEQGETYFSVLAIYKNLDIFALLVRIYRKLLEYCNQKNIFLLSLSTPLLSKMIDESDAPFIYEKTGEYLNHFMIDEFQDTSALQWHSLSPLVLNSISQGQSSLVVGDVKQSIYRWRNGDWNLLATQLKQQFGHYPVVEKNLPFNWRSAKNVIAFNNALYAFSAQYIQQKSQLTLGENLENFADALAIAKVYEESEQKLPEKSTETNGYAEIKLIPAKKKGQPDDEDELEENLAYTVETIERLIEGGYQPSDIAILVRVNKEGNKIAKCLMEHQKKNPEREHLFRFTSGDSVFLGASKVVNLLVSAIECMVDAKNQIARIRLNYLLTSLKQGDELACLLPNAKNHAAAFELNMDKLRAMPLFDMVQHLLDELIHKNQINIDFEKPFIDAFLDAIIKFQKNAESDTVRFLEWWEQKGSETSIAMSENQNAIRIMTIHKSKGLEFNAVIIPFANWGNRSKPNLIWCQPPASLSALPIVPLKTDKNLEKTVFKSGFAHEQFLEEVDNLNLLYVATTRARQALFVATTASESENAKGVQPLINGFTAHNSFTNLGIDKNETANKLWFGTLTPPHKKSNEPETQPAFETTQTSLRKHALNLKLHAPEFFTSDPNQNPNRLKGKVYHFILEHTKTLADLPQAIDKAIKQGFLTLADKELVHSRLANAISATAASNWFSHAWQVRTEVPILLPNGDVKRPDRVIASPTETVVIDYKFTSHHAPEHLAQVAEYKQLISQMETKKVSGFVWYVLENLIMEV